MVNSGWINDAVYSKDFINHGQRVKTYVEIAKSQGLPAYVGALQANFGNPYETGIVDLKNQLETLSGQIISNNLTIQNNLVSIPEALEKIADFEIQATTL